MLAEADSTRTIVKSKDSTNRKNVSKKHRKDDNR